MTATTKIVNGKSVELSADEQAAIEAGWSAYDSELIAAQAADSAMAYRRARAQAYHEFLGKEPDQMNTIGDVLDVLIKKIRTMDAAKPAAHAEFDAMVAEIDRIKAENPKP